MVRAGCGSISFPHFSMKGAFSKKGKALILSLAVLGSVALPIGVQIASAMGWYGNNWGDGDWDRDDFRRFDRDDFRRFDRDDFRWGW